MKDIPEVGAPYCWKPAAFSDHSDAVAGILGVTVRLNGRVVYVNEEHRFFRVEARFPGGVLRECFKF